MASEAPAAPYLRTRLFVMMVLQFVIWGAWLPLIYGYLPALKFTWWEQVLILNAFPVSTIIGMFFSNQFADRQFSAERFMAFSHLVGGLAILGLGFTSSFWPFFALMLVHCLLYVPTLSIANSIAFANIKDPAKEFGPIRMGGTIGWILAAWPFTLIFVDWAKVREASPKGAIDWLGTVLGSGLQGEAFTRAVPWTFIVAGFVSIALALYCLTLPHTPPKKAGEGAGGKLAWLQAVKLLRQPFVLILWLVAFVDAFVLYCYFNWTGTFLGSDVVHIKSNWIMPVMSICQVAEIVTMAALGYVLKRLGWRVTMVVGILGHTLRFGIYAFFPEQTWLIVAIQVVHGICYAFFFATVYIFVDAYFPKDVRSSAQGLFNVMILGVGSLVANSVCPWLIQKVYTTTRVLEAGATEMVTDYRGLFLVPCLIALGAAIVLALFFKPPKQEQAAAPPAAA